MNSAASPYSLLCSRSLERAEETFLKTSDTTFTYKETLDEVNRRATFLAGQHVKKGDKVALLIENEIDFPLFFFAINAYGAVTVPLNPAYKKEEIEFALENSDAKILIYSDALAEKVNAVDSNVTLVSAGTSLPEKTSGTTTIDLSVDDPAAILYTSGTSGNPKGVILPQRSYVIGGESFAMRAELTSEDRMMVILPFFHVNAQVYSLMGCLVAGASLYISPGFSASGLWDEVVTHSITQFNFLGVIANILLRQDECESESKHSLRVVCGAGLSKETIEAFEERFSVPLIETYGLTECPMGTSNLLQERLPGSIGKPSRHPDKSFFTEAKIVNDLGEELPAGKIGEVLLRSPALALGYLKNEAATNEVFKNGWFHTGDNCYKDKEGFFYFVDRKKDIIRRRGENISSKQIEQAIMLHPQVKEAAVVPFPGVLGEDEIAGFVVLKEPQSLNSYDIKEYLKNHLDSFRIPSLVVFRDSLPKTPTNKLQKRKLRELVPKFSKDALHQSLAVKDDIGKSPFVIGKFVLLNEKSEFLQADSAQSESISKSIEALLNKHALTFDHFEKIYAEADAPDSIAKEIGVRKSRLENLSEIQDLASFASGKLYLLVDIPKNLAAIVYKS